MCVEAVLFEYMDFFKRFRRVPVFVTYGINFITYSISTVYTIDRVGDDSNVTVLTLLTVGCVWGRCYLSTWIFPEMS